MKRQNLRTVSLIVVTFTYLLIGAAIFGYLESEHEVRQREYLELIELIVKRKYNISDEDFTVLTTTVIKSVPHKAGIQWKFPGAFYFATTVVTTIGYGHSTPATMAGRSFCMIYALIGIPLGLVMFQSIGERLNTIVGCALKYSKRCFKARNPEVTQTNLVMVVSVLSTILMTSMAAVFAKYERWDYFDALYYCFITLTTIGFGDYVALQKESALQSKPEYVALSLIFILFGLSVVSSAVNLLVLKFLTLNTEDERRDEQLRYTANLNPILLQGDVITSSAALQQPAVVASAANPLVLAPARHDSSHAAALWPTKSNSNLSSASSDRVGRQAALCAHQTMPLALLGAQSPPQLSSPRLLGHACHAHSNLEPEEESDEEEEEEEEESECLGDGELAAALLATSNEAAAEYPVCAHAASLLGDELSADGREEDEEEEDEEADSDDSHCQGQRANFAVLYGGVERRQEPHQARLAALSRLSSPSSLSDRQQAPECAKFQCQMQPADGCSAARQQRRARQEQLEARLQRRQQQQQQLAVTAKISERRPAALCDSSDWRRRGACCAQSGRRELASQQQQQQPQSSCSCSWLSLASERQKAQACAHCLDDAHQLERRRAGRLSARACHKHRTCPANQTPLSAPWTLSARTRQVAQQNSLTSQWSARQHLMPSQQSAFSARLDAGLLEEQMAELRAPMRLPSSRSSGSLAARSVAIGRSLAEQAQGERGRATSGSVARLVCKCCCEHLECIEQAFGHQASQGHRSSGSSSKKHEASFNAFVPAEQQSASSSGFRSALETRRARSQGAAFVESASSQAAVASNQLPKPVPSACEATTRLLLLPALLQQETHDDDAQNLQPLRLLQQSGARNQDERHEESSAPATPSRDEPRFLNTNASTSRAQLERSRLKTAAEISFSEQHSSFAELSAAKDDTKEQTNQQPEPKAQPGQEQA